ncbi:MAG: alpha/beta fold hydrolase [Nitrospirae bacterium]|nr:MAG: alpha/beta fold hydrolase [Nitrospirota bacterium]
MDASIPATEAAGAAAPARAEAPLSYEINLRTYQWVGRLMDLLLKVAPLNLRVHNLRDQAERGDIFLFNHFSRFETFIPQYILYRHAGVIGRSLAAPEFVGPDAFGAFLRSLGAIPTDMPGIIDFMGDEILAGRKMVIFPEGSMIKDKKVVDRRGRLQVYSRDHGVRRPPHTGSAVTALKAQYRLEYLRRAFAEGNTRLVDHLLAEWPEEDAEQLQARLARPIAIVPANITFFPLRITDNVLQAVAERLGKVQSRRLLEELRIEGNILFRPTDMDVRFGEPIVVAEYLGRVDRWLLGRIYHLLARRAEGRAGTERPLRWLRRLQRRRTRELAETVMRRYMREMYALTTINLSHLASNVIYRSMTEHGRERLPVREVGEETYLSLKRLQRSRRIFLHADLKPVERNLEIPLRPLERMAGCLERAEQQHLLHIEGDELLLSPKLTDEHDFDEIRLENHIQLAVNESEPVTECVEAVRGVLALDPAARAREMAARLREDDARLYREDRAAYDHPKYHRLNQHEAGRLDGSSLFLEGERRVGALLIHGFSASPPEMAPLAEAVNGEGFPACAPRLRGHGTSPYDLARRRWEEWLDSARIGLLYLRQHCDRVVAVGHSMGGCLAYLLAAEGAVDGVVSICTPTRLASRRSTLVPLLHRANQLASLVPGVDGLKNFEPVTPEYPENNYRHLPISGVRQLQAVIAAFQGRLGEVRCPCLVLQGDDDPTVEPVSAEEISRGLAHAPHEVVMLPADHHVLVMDDRLGVHRRVREFLEAAEG